MKRRGILIPLALLLTAYLPSVACDFCNCLRGINPYFNESDKIMLHTLLQGSHYTSTAEQLPFGSKRAALTRGSGIAAIPPALYHGGAHADGDSLLPVYERRTTIELAYEHHFSDRLMMTAILPYIVATIESGDDRMTAGGAGDPTLMAHYILPGPLPGDESRLLLGGGVELPLGRTTLHDMRGVELDPRLQPGSGSFDLVLNAMMTTQVEGWTLAADIYGKINSANSGGTRIGSSFSASTTVNHDLFRNNEDQLALVGIAGVRMEHAAKDRIGGAIDADSGFDALYGSLGGTLVYGALKLDGTVLLPLAQHRKAGAPVEEQRILLGVRCEL